MLGQPRPVMHVMWGRVQYFYTLCHSDALAFPYTRPLQEKSIIELHEIRRSVHFGAQEMCFTWNRMQECMTYF